MHDELHTHLTLGFRDGCPACEHVLSVLIDDTEIQVLDDGSLAVA